MKNDKLANYIYHHRKESYKNQKDFANLINDVYDELDDVCVLKETIVYDIIDVICEKFENVPLSEVDYKEIVDELYNLGVPKKHNVRELKRMKYEFMITYRMNSSKFDDLYKKCFGKEFILDGFEPRTECSSSSVDKLSVDKLSWDKLHSIKSIFTDCLRKYN